LCCKVLAIDALNKPHGKWCSHCKAGVDCRIYQTRPTECREFTCTWLVDTGLGPEWKPERSRIVVTIAPDRNGLHLRCDPSFPDAWRKEPYYARVKQWARGATETDGVVIVCVGDRMTLVSPDREFYLGTVAEDETIIREYDGNRLVAAYVKKTAGAGA